MKLKYLLSVGFTIICLGCLMKMNINQTVNEEPLDETKIELSNVIEEIKNVGKLVLTEETGSASIEYNSSNNKLLSWLTNTRTVVSLDYEVLLGVDLNDIIFLEDDNTIIVLLPEEFDILAIETNNKEIKSDYSFLSKIESDDLKIELEEKIINDIRKNGITEEAKIKCMKSFENNLRKIAKNMNVNISFY